MKYIISLVLIFTCTGVYAQAVAQIRSHNQLTATGTTNHTTLDSFYNSKGQANGLASLDASGNLVQNAGTVTLSGGYVKQTNGTATGTQLTSVQINSGTATLSGVASPYIAQTNGTGSGNTLTNLKVLTALMVGTSTGDALLEVYGGNIDFERTDSAPLFNFYRNSAIPAAEDSLGVIYFYGNNATPAVKEYAAINGVITDKTAGSEDGRIGFWAMVAGVTAERMRLEGGSLGIGTTTPQTKLSVEGDISIQSSGYLNFNPGAGTASSGYGIRDNSGTTQFKNSGGTWTDIPTGASGGGFVDNGSNITEITVTDQVVFGSTTASNRQLTCVGSSTFYGQVAIGSNTTVFDGLTNTLMELAIGDSDTGIKWIQDGDFALYGNSNLVLKIDGNANKVLIGTTTSGTKLNVGGTITAAGFSGDGAGLTNLNVTVAFSTITGIPTDSGTFSVTGASGKIPVGSTSGKLDDSWLSDVIKLTATTTVQTAQSYGQLNIYSTQATTSTPFRFYRLTNSTGYRADGYNELNEIAYQTSSGTETATEYTISTDNTDENGSGLATNAFDGTVTTTWSSNGALPHWIIADYGTGNTQVFTGVNIYTYSGGGGHNTQGFTIAGSLDKVSWTNIYTGTCTSTQGVWQQFTLPDSDKFTNYDLQYRDPVNGNILMSINAPGTATLEASYIYCNASTTVFGLGTNTAITATTTAYSGWFAGAVRATAFNVASTEKIKENIEDIIIKPNLLDAEAEAKNKYITDNKASWVISNQSKYKTVINEAGTGTVTKIDTVTMESVYSNYIELAWASDLNQGTYTENIQKKYEKAFWQEFNSMRPRSWNPKEKPGLTRRGFVVEEVPEGIKGDDGQSIDPMAVLAKQQKAMQSMKAEIDKLKAIVNP